MGEAGKHALRVGFDRAIKLEFHGARVFFCVGERMRIGNQLWPTFQATDQSRRSYATPHGLCLITERMLHQQDSRIL